MREKKRKATTGMPYADGKLLFHSALCFAKILTVREKLSKILVTIYMKFLTYIQSLTTIGPASVSEITCLIKMDTDTRQTDRQKRESTLELVKK